MKNKTLLTDFYEINMSYTYFKTGAKDDQVYFDLFFRRNPFKGGYTISAGLDNIIDYLCNFKFDEDDIDYLRSLNKYDEDFLEYLKNLRFTGDVYAVPDGTPVFPNEPVITIKADVITAQLIETDLLNNFNHGALVMTKSKRVTKAAPNIPVMEFGARRGRGEESSIEASKYAVMGGCVATSNTLAGKKYGLPLSGTMAHSLVTKYDNEYDAFLDYAKYNSDNTVFLVDTYDTLRSGIPNAIKVAQDFLVPNGYPFKGIRIDSGDLAYLSKEARKMLDEAGFYDTRICVSNGLDEYTISELLKQSATIDFIGVGENLSAAKEIMGGVYKLVAVEKKEEIIPRIKVSNDSVKTINPGYKKVYRFYDKETNYALGDVITMYDEVISEDKYILVDPVDRWKKTELENYVVKELQVPIFKNGELVYTVPTINESKEYCEDQFSTLYPEVTRLLNPHKYYVDLSEKLLALKDKLIEEHSGNKVLVKRMGTCEK